jgi:hypothetical protein
MKQIMLTIMVLILMIGAQTVRAESEYQLGFKRGVSDARIPTVGMTPILKSAYDEILKHPHAFFQGWMDGFCSISDMASDGDEFTFDCSRESSQDQLGSGFQHGVSDAYLDMRNMSKLDFIEKPYSGFGNQTQQFNHGYIQGWCSIMGPNTGKETDVAMFDCERKN